MLTTHTPIGQSGLAAEEFAKSKFGSAHGVAGSTHLEELSGRSGGSTLGGRHGAWSLEHARRYKAFEGELAAVQGTLGGGAAHDDAQGEAAEGEGGGGAHGGGQSEGREHVEEESQGEQVDHVQHAEMGLAERVGIVAGKANEFDAMQGLIAVGRSMAQSAANMACGPNYFIGEVFKALAAGVGAAREVGQRIGSITADMPTLGGMKPGLGLDEFLEQIRQAGGEGEPDLEIANLPELPSPGALLAKWTRWFQWMRNSAVNLRNFVQRLLGIKSFFGRIRYIVQTTRIGAEWIIDRALGVVTGILNVARRFNPIKAAQKAFEAARRLYTKATTAFRGILKFIAQKKSALKAFIANKRQKLVSWIKDKKSKLVTLIQQRRDRIFQNIRNKTAWIGNQIAQKKSALQAWISQKTNAIYNMLPGPAKAAWDWVANKKKEVTAWIADKRNWLKGWVSDKRQRLFDWINEKRRQVTDWIHTQRENLEAWVVEKRDGLLAWAREKKSGFKGWFLEKFGAFRGWVAEKKQELGGIGKSVWQGAKALKEKGKKGAETIGQTVIDKAKVGIGLVKKGVQVGIGIAGKAIKRAQETAAWAKDKALGIAQPIIDVGVDGAKRAVEFGKGIAHKGMDVGKRVVGGVGSVIGGAIEKAKDLVARPVGDGTLTGPFFPGNLPAKSDEEAEELHKSSSDSEASASVGDAVIFVNGIDTSLGDHYRAAQRLSNQLRKPVVGVYNASSGFGSDLLQCVSDKFFDMGRAFGKGNPAVATLRGIIERFGDPQKQNGGLQIFAHSQGSIIVSEALRQARGAGADIKKNEVTTFGNAAFTFPQGPKYHHYAHDDDLVSTAVGTTSIVSSLMNQTMVGRGLRDLFLGKSTDPQKDTTVLHQGGSFIRPHSVNDASGQNDYIGNLDKFRRKEAQQLPQNRVMPSTQRSGWATGFGIARGVGQLAAEKVASGYNFVDRTVRSVPGSPVSIATPAWPLLDTAFRGIGSSLSSVGSMLGRGIDSFFGGLNAIQRSADQPESSDVDPQAVQERVHREGGGGQPLDASLRGEMEQHFGGADLSMVRLHTDSASASLSNELGARAFTVGSDVVFSPNQYDPGSKEGRRLLAHELTHVIQQTGQGGDQTRFYHPRGGDEMEQEAQHSADRFVMNWGSREGLAVDEYKVAYTAPESGLTENDLSKLDRLSQESLREAERQLRARGRLTMGTLDEVEVDLEIDLETHSDQDIVQLWAAAIVDAVGVQLGASRSRTASPSREEQLATQKMERITVPDIPKDMIKGFTHINQMYVLNFRVFGEEFGTVDHPTAVRALRNKYVRLRATFEAYEETVIALIKESFLDYGRVRQYEDLNKPANTLHQMYWSLITQNLPLAYTLMQQAEIELKAWERAFFKNIDERVASAEKWIKRLEVVRDTSRTIVRTGALIVSGGNEKVADAVDAGYGATQKVAQQSMEVHLGLRDKVDWSGIAIEAAMDLILGRMLGPLLDKISGRLGKIPPFNSIPGGTLKNYIRDTIKNRGGDIVRIVVQTAVDNARGKKDAMSLEQMLDAIADMLTDPKTYFMDAVNKTIDKGMHKAYGGSGSAAPPAPPAGRDSEGGQLLLPPGAPPPKQLPPGPPPPKQLEAGPPAPKQLPAGPPPRKQLPAGPPPPKQLEAGPPAPKQLPPGDPPPKQLKAPDDAPPPKSVTPAESEAHAKQLMQQDGWQKLKADAEAGKLSQDQVAQLTKARVEMQQRALAKVQDEFPNVRPDNQGAPGFKSDIDITFLPKKQPQTPEEVAAAVRESGMAAQRFAEHLRSELNGQDPGHAIDTNAYTYTGADAPVNVPAAHARAAAAVQDATGLAAMKRAFMSHPDGPAKWEAYKKQMLESLPRTDDDPDSPMADYVDGLKKDLNKQFSKADELYDGAEKLKREGMDLAAAEGKSGEKLVESLGRERAVAKLNEQLANEFKANPPNWTRIRELQGQIKLVEPGAYATAAAKADVVDFQQAMKNEETWEIYVGKRKSDKQVKQVEDLRQLSQSAQDSLGQWVEHTGHGDIHSQLDATKKYYERVEFCQWASGEPNRQSPEMVGINRKNRQDLERMVEQGMGQPAGSFNEAMGNAYVAKKMAEAQAMSVKLHIKAATAPPSATRHGQPNPTPAPRDVPPPPPTTPDSSPPPPPPPSSPAGGGGQDGSASANPRRTENKGGGPGNPRESVRRKAEDESKPAPRPSMTEHKETIVRNVMDEHPGLHRKVAEDAALGASHEAYQQGAGGQRGAGADIILHNGKGREVSVHTGQFTVPQLAKRIREEKAQAGTDEVYLQVNTGSRNELLQMIPRLRHANVGLEGTVVRIYGPDGSLWWSGTMGALKEV